jgi:acyl-CoA thioesterase-2
MPPAASPAPDGDLTAASLAPPVLAAVLDVERLDRDLFRGLNAPTPTSRLYGGQVAAQALRAAGATVDEDRRPHSLHGYFLRAGRPDRPVLLFVDRDRDGRSFSARHVRAVQEGEVIFSMLASFQRPSVDGELDLVDRNVPAPPAGGASSHDGLLEVVELTPGRIVGDRVLWPDALWVRSATPLPDAPLVRACALAYVSDLGSGFGQLTDPAVPGGGPSLDHAVWFHHDIAVDEWVHLDLQAAKAIGGRGTYLGALRSADGRLGAMVAQEHLLRAARPAELEQMRVWMEGRPG